MTRLTIGVMRGKVWGAYERGRERASEEGDAWGRGEGGGIQVADSKNEIEGARKRGKGEDSAFEFGARGMIASECERPAPYCIRDGVLFLSLICFGLLC